MSAPSHSAKIPDTMKPARNSDSKKEDTKPAGSGHGKAPGKAEAKTPSKTKETNPAVVAGKAPSKTNVTDGALKGAPPAVSAEVPEKVETTPSPVSDEVKPDDDEYASFNKKDVQVLEMKYYEEEEQVLAAKKKAQDLELTANRALEWNIRFTFCLTMIAAILTAVFTYINFQLPPSVYSHHILREIYMSSDSFITDNDFAKPFGLQTCTPFPVAIAVLYAIILFFIYTAQYPKENACIRLTRYLSFGIMEGYLFVCLISYVIDSINMEERMDTFFLEDKAGFAVGDKHGNNLPFHFLDNSQEYFECCGYRDRGEWQEVFPENFTGVWPMSCCSTKRSGIACYNPVEETVRYQPPEDEEEDHGGGHDDDNEKKHEKAAEASDGKGDEKDEEGYVTKERLHASYCFDEEFHLSITSTCLIIVPLFVFMLLAAINFALSTVVSNIVSKYEIQVHRNSYQFGI